MTMNIPLLYSIITTLSVETSVCKVALTIANFEFKNQKTTSVVHGGGNSDQVTEFLTNYKGCVKTIDMNKTNNEAISFEQVLLFVTSPGEFLYAAKNLDKNITIPSKVVTILSDPNNLSTITEIAWEFDITDLIIITIENESVVMYTYYPYTNLKCGNTTPVKVEFRKHYFYSKFKNFHGCQTRLGSVPSPPYAILECVDKGPSRFLKGLSGDLFMLVANHLNTTLKISCLLTTYKLYIELLRNKTIHVVTPMIYDQNYMATQNTRVFHFYESVWCGPLQREIYAWAKVLVPLMNNITIIVCITYFTLVVVIRLTNKIEGRNCSHTAWKAFAIILSQPSATTSKSWLVNFLFAQWFWFCMVVTIAYQGVLVRGLQTKLLEPRFGRIEDAVKLVDGYGGSALQRNIYNGTPIFDGYETKTIPEIYAYLTPISRGKRYLIMVSRLVLLGYSLQIVEVVNRWPMVTVMTPRWGGGVEIRKSEMRLIEGGFFEKLLRDEDLKVKRREALSSDPSESNTGHLDFVTLSSGFYGLGIMGVLCFVVLLFEISYYKLTHTQSLIERIHKRKI